VLGRVHLRRAAALGRAPAARAPVPVDAAWRRRVARPLHVVPRALPRRRVDALRHALAEARRLTRIDLWVRLSGWRARCDRRAGRPSPPEEGLGCVIMI